MKKFWNTLSKREILFFIYGLIFGVFASIYIFSALVPNGEQMIKLYHLDQNKKIQIDSK